VETVPPIVRSVSSTREEITIQWSEAVIASGAGAADFGRSVLNPFNYLPTFIASQTAPSANTQNACEANPGSVNYSYFDPNRTAIVNGNIVSSPGFVTVVKPIQDISYNAATNIVTLRVAPMTEGQGSGQAETVYVFIQSTQVERNNASCVNNPVPGKVAARDTIFDLNSNAFAGGAFTAPVQEGRTEWRIQMSATSNVPGASPDTNNFFGVGNGSSNGFDLPGQNGDIPEAAPPGPNHVFLYSSRGNNEPGFAGNGGNYTQDIQSRLLPNDSRFWPRIGVTTDLGATGAPATINLTWNLSVSGREVPRTHSAELVNLNPQAGEPVSIDMTQRNSFSYTVISNGLSQTRFFSIRVTAPSLFQAPFQLSEGFNMVGIPVRAQNASVNNVFFGLSPITIYRFSPATGYEIFPISPTFTTIEPGRGYFVRPRTAGFTMSVVGVPVVGQEAETLQRGWSMISNPYTVPITGENISVRTSSGETISFEEAVNRGLVQNEIFTFDPATRGYTAPLPLTDTVLDPWRGYWLLVNDPSITLIFDKPTTVAP